MPNRAYIVNPVVTSDEAGAEESIRDFEVIGDHSATVEAFNRGYLDDFTPDSEGRYHYNYVEDGDQPEEGGSSFDEIAYVDALFDANPDLRNAIAWAGDNLPEEQVAEYDKLIESDDLDEVNGWIDCLLYEYAEREQVEEPANEEQPTSDDDALSEEDRVVMQEAIDDLVEKEPAGSEYAQQWVEMASQAEKAGDMTYAIVAQATAAFHAGQLSAEQAIGYCTKHCSTKELARVYKYLQSQ